MEQQKQLHLIMEWDLQWFAKDGPGGEKTEPATAKKLREAREDGKVVKSKELTAAFDLIILFLVLKIFVSFVGSFFISCDKTKYSPVFRECKLYRLIFRKKRLYYLQISERNSADECKRTDEERKNLLLHR